MAKSEESCCRLCLRDGPISTMTNLIENKSLIKAIFLMTSITIQETENLTPYLCRKCLSNLHHCIAFREACLFNNAIYRRRLERKQTKPTENEEPKFQKESSPVQLPEQIFIKETKELVKEEEDDDDFCDREDEDVEKDEVHSVKSDDSSDHETLATVKAKLDSKAEDKAIVEGLLDELCEGEPEPSDKPSKETFPCEKCSYVFPTRQRRILHVLAAHRIGKNKITVKKIIKPAVKKDIIPKNNPVKQYTCVVCKKIFPSFTAERNHFKEVHPDYKPHGCETCGKRFKAKSDLRIHIRIHTGERPYECDICHRKLIASNALADHKRRIHGTEPRYPRKYPEPGVHPCDQCDKVYSNPEGLKTHVIAIHSGEPQFACKICGKKFNRLGTRQYHEKTVHSVDRPYKCTYCEKAFKSRPEWRVHERLHTGDWPFMCELCGKRFYCSSNAKKHKRIHRNETVYANGRVVRKRGPKKKKEEDVKEEEAVKAADQKNPEVT